MFSKLLEPVLLRCGVTAGIEEVRSSVMKEQRILDVLEPVVSAHRLIVDPTVIERDHESIQKYETQVRSHKSLFYQMTHICREKNALRFDDRVDALAMMVAHFVDLMAQDSQKVADRQHEEWMRQQMESYMRAPLNRQFSGQKTKWVGLV